MRNLLAFLSTLMLLLSLSCAVNPSEIKANLGQEVELEIGQTVSIEGEQLKVKFEGVVNDSRCPEGATCIWQGEVSCVVEIDYSGSVYSKTITQPGLTEEPSVDTFQEYNITFSVLPYPKLGSDIKPSAYRLRIMINKSAKFEDNKLFLISYGEPGNLKNVIAGTEITATFNSSDGQVGGSAGCNIYGGKYQISGNTLSISEVYSTEMACIKPGVMIQEQEFLTLLIKSQSFLVDDTTLTILCSNGQQLNFSTAGGT